MKNFKNTIDGTVTMSASIKINFVRTMLHGEVLRELDGLASQVLGTTNDHPNFIKEGLLRYFT